MNSGEMNIQRNQEGLKHETRYENMTQVKDPLQKRTKVFTSNVFPSVDVTQSSSNLYVTSLTWEQKHELIELSLTRSRTEKKRNNDNFDRPVIATNIEYDSTK